MYSDSPNMKRKNLTEKKINVNVNSDIYTINVYS